jgi:hypothetical protein
MFPAVAESKRFVGGGAGLGMVGQGAGEAAVLDMWHGAGKDLRHGVVTRGDCTPDAGRLFL